MSDSVAGKAEGCVGQAMRPIVVSVGVGGERVARLPSHRLISGSTLPKPRSFSARKPGRQVSTVVEPT